MFRETAPESVWLREPERALLCIYPVAKPSRAHEGLPKVETTPAETTPLARPLARTGNEEYAVRRFATSRRHHASRVSRPHVAPSKLKSTLSTTSRRRLPRRRHARAVGDLRKSPCPLACRRPETPTPRARARLKPERKSPVDHVETTPRRSPLPSTPATPRDDACRDRLPCPPHE